MIRILCLFMWVLAPLGSLLAQERYLTEEYEDLDQALLNPLAVKELYLVNNGPLPPTIRNLKNLEKLTLTGNDVDFNLKELPDEFYELRNLKHLEIHYTMIDSISPLIRKLEKLEYMKVYAKLPPEIGYLKNLQVLDCGGRFLPDSLVGGSLDRLHTLIFGRPLPWICDLRNLRTLTIDIQDSGMLAYVPQVEHLSIWDVQAHVAMIPSGLAKLTNLRSLHFPFIYSQLDYQQLFDRLAHLPKLDSLEIAYNQPYKWQIMNYKEVEQQYPVFFPALRHLSMRNCPIGFLRFFAGLKTIESLEVPLHSKCIFPKGVRKLTAYSSYSGTADIAQHFPELEELTLYHPYAAYGDQSLEKLSRLHTLTIRVLGHEASAHASLRSLDKIPQLRNLTFLDPLHFPLDFKLSRVKMLKAPPRSQLMVDEHFDERFPVIDTMLVELATKDTSERVFSERSFCYWPYNPHSEAIFPNKPTKFSAARHLPNAYVPQPAIPLSSPCAIPLHYAIWENDTTSRAIRKGWEPLQSMHLEVDTVDTFAQMSFIRLDYRNSWYPSGLKQSEQLKVWSYGKLDARCKGTFHPNGKPARSEAIMYRGKTRYIYRQEFDEDGREVKYEEIVKGKRK